MHRLNFFISWKDFIFFLKGFYISIKHLTNLFKRVSNILERASIFFKNINQKRRPLYKSSIKKFFIRLILFLSRLDFKITRLFFFKTISIFLKILSIISREISLIFEKLFIKSLIIHENYHALNLFSSNSFQSKSYKADKLSFSLNQRIYDGKYPLIYKV